ncbi:MAG: Glu-tRNA(Gln) amidotransferase subunit GatD [Candidatus Woesearchaeota archaeon]
MVEAKSGKENEKSTGLPLAGDKVRIISKGKTEEGILMPSSDENVVMLKLSNGYNMGFEKKDLEKIEFIEKPKLNVTSLVKVKKNEKLFTITILHTGGTIASKVDYETGAVTAKFSAEDLLEMFPELGKIANIETELVANMMSEDMNFPEYQQIAMAVKKHAELGVKGIIIGHGTDTLSYTAAALSFMFEEINIPVLLVGSQRSPDRGSSDAALNLICAAKFIAETDFVGVAVCMHESSNDEECAILPPTKVRKMHTSRRDAFKTINDSPIALVNLNHIEFLKKDYHKKSVQDKEVIKEKIILKDKFENKVGLLKVHPNMNSNLFKFFTENYKAFIIEGTGLGHAPTNTKENQQSYEYLKKFTENGGIVGITSQCLFGRVHPYVYTNLRRLSDLGCIFCEDMLPETAFIKLAWLLGNYSDEETKKLLAENLRGEIKSQLQYEDDFLK